MTGASRVVIVAWSVIAASCVSAPETVGDDPVRIGSVLVTSASSATTAAAPPVTSVSVPPPLDDPAWRPLEEGVWLQQPGLHWLRAEVELPASAEPGHPFGIAISALASYELAWDGVTIGRSGRVGTTKTDELPGPIDNIFAIPATAIAIPATAAATPTTTTTTAAPPTPTTTTTATTAATQPTTTTTTATTAATQPTTTTTAATPTATATTTTAATPPPTPTPTTTPSATTTTTPTATTTTAARSTAAGSTAAGTHVVTMRLSNFHYDGNLSNSFYGLHVGDYNALVTRDVRARFAPLLVLGWLVIAVALFAFVYFAQGRRPASLLFAVICVFVAVALLGQSWRWIFGYSYDHHLTRLLLVTVASLGASVLLPIAFAYELAMRRIWLVMVASGAIALVALVGLDGYNLKATAMFVGATVFALAIAVAAARRHRRGAWPSVAGLVVCLVPLVVAPHRYHDAGFFVGFSALLVALLGVVATRIRDERRQAARATLRSARLELELVKRGIQPHFLMNVLTSILEWIEQEPARAARFVEALADELRLLSEVSRERSIPIGLEVELCQAHVALMAQRLERDVRLAVHGLEATEKVPPAIFHTLIENALTHGRFADGPIELALEASRTNRARVYRLTSHERALADPALAPPRSERGGLAYVRARLQELYGERARLRGEATPIGWVTTIEIQIEIEIDDGTTRTSSTMGTEELRRDLGRTNVEP